MRFIRNRSHGVGMSLTIDKGSGGDCTCCGRTLDSRQTQYSVEFQSARRRVTCDMHVACFERWFTALGAPRAAHAGDSSRATRPSTPPGRVH